jgi:hypothetical protein
MSLIFAAQLTAVATAVLGAFAFTTAILAGLAYRKQSKEVGLLLEENERETAERRRAQAERIFIGAPRTPGRKVSPYAMNASDLPIFGVQLWYPEPAGLPDPEDLGVILPDQQVGAGAREFDDADDALTRTILTFRDAASRSWVRLPGGDLKKQSRATTRDSVQAAVGRNMPTHYGRLDIHITGSVLDMIEVYPRSHGILRLPGEYSSSSRPPEHEVNILGEDGGGYTAERLTGSPEHYTVTYDVWNHHDSPTIAALIRTDQADQGQPDNPGG